MTKSQLLEYTIAMRDFCIEMRNEYKKAGNLVMANNMLFAYHALGKVYRCMTDNEFARQEHKDWTGKEL